MQEVSFESTLVFFKGIAFVWVSLIGAAGGALGAAYNLIVVRTNLLRARLHTGGRTKVIEAVGVAFVIFSVYFWLPVALGCVRCPTGEHGSGGHRRRLAATNGSASTDAPSCEYSDSHHPFVRHMCPDGEYSEVATLLLSGQEGMLNHLLSRSEHEVFSIRTLAICLPLYFVLASLSFGIYVPAGNFVPGIAIGACLGRLVGLALQQAGVTLCNEDGSRWCTESEWTPGAYALIGAAGARIMSLWPAVAPPVTSLHPQPPTLHPQPPSLHPQPAASSPRAQALDP